ncbi:heavy metal-translocating P-type ATPase, Cd/Co/Hg/Pb/Zn-transporting [Desulfitobacterium dichloroeliminans LMG P-21439]|uniref:Cd(2+)-exporting ATPase n=1 Tax=Desulfitobacterium dichloroeliminans (strain LMG P-21439 / DCA1) TaxID=871963 RepID=L0F447_DESDL|nr:heavy metal translocating P-type ATPase [Desulfitobacterium dichloroeliminans]AGA68594.1 heavy metal-translocating P-type ATPase, Cd/Co/Hg/Pb/Zn-transporting [Desulfitobacterium dichloroeliminans LMG P-21439]
MKNRLWRIILAFVIFIAALFINPYLFGLSLTLFIASYILIGGDVVLRAGRNILRGSVFDENFLMSIATIGAFAIGEYPEGVAVMLFYQVGELFQSYAVDKSRKSITSLMDIRPDYANVKRGDELVQTDPDEVSVGELIVIKPGERVPLDGKVLEGYSMVDTTALTGESVPREVNVGDDILSGCINLNGLLIVKVSKEYGESTVAKILDLVENASSKKSKSEQFITKFARYYTPIVVIIAVLLTIIPPLVFEGTTFSDWIYRALTFLVVSCPCALVISIPLSFFGGIGGASKSGILVKGSNYLEALAKTEIIVFDKTGTLTKGVFNVQEIHPEGLSKEELLELTAYAESFSNHPISHSLKRAFGKEIDNERISNIQEIAGHGVSALIDDQEVMAGNFRLMEKNNISYFKGEVAGTVVHVAVNRNYAGYILIADEIKADAAQAISQLKNLNIKHAFMLTGDTQSVGIKVAKDLGLDKVYAELLPGEKVEKLEEIFSQKSEGGKIVYVGDGINDAPVLARADIGIAMGGLGSDAAIEAADIVIMNDEPSKIATAIKISKKTLKIARQNAGFAIGIKVAVLVLSAFGLATMWEAVFADVGVTVLAILNSFRAMDVKGL